MNISNHCHITFYLQHIQTHTQKKKKNEMILPFLNIYIWAMVFFFYPPHTMATTTTTTTVKGYFIFTFGWINTTARGKPVIFLISLYYGCHCHSHVSCINSLKMLSPNSKENEIEIMLSDLCFSFRTSSLPRRLRFRPGLKQQLAAVAIECISTFQP